MWESIFNLLWKYSCAKATSFLVSYHRNHRGGTCLRFWINFVSDHYLVATYFFVATIVCTNILAWLVVTHTAWCCIGVPTFSSPIPDGGTEGFLRKKLFFLVEARVSTGTSWGVFSERMWPMSATDSSPQAGHGYAVFHKHQFYSTSLYFTDKHTLTLWQYVHFFYTRNIFFLLKLDVLKIFAATRLKCS